MLYDTIAENIKAAFEEAKVEGFAVGKAEGLAEALTMVVGHRFPDQAEAFRQCLASSDRNIWPSVSEVMNWPGTGAEFMELLAVGQPASKFDSGGVSDRRSTVWRHPGSRL